jgi:hypothetical protein
MNCEAFDQDIEATFKHYGKLGVNVELYSVNDRATPTPPGDWISVTVVVTPVVPHPIPHTDTWYYGGVISHTSHQGAPLGVLPIDRNRLVGACKAVAALPDGFPVAEASCSLFWPLVPGSNEPAYNFTASAGTSDMLVIVGAYSGKILNSHQVGGLTPAASA